MYNKFEQDTWLTFEVIVPTLSKYWHEMCKIPINWPFLIFSVIIELVRELVISDMPNKFEQDTCKTFEVNVPTRLHLLTGNAKNRTKSAIISFCPAIIELVREMDISNMHNKFEQDTLKSFQVIVPTNNCQRRHQRCRRRRRTSIAIAHLFKFEI